MQPLRFDIRRVRRSRMILIGGALVASAALAGSLQMVSASPRGPAPVLTTITPCRLFDTRSISPVGTRSTPVADIYTANVWGTNGNCTVPSTALGVVANVTVTDGTADSFLTVWPTDQPRPLASSLNWKAGQAPTPNQVTSDLSATGQLSFYNNAGTVNVIVDIVGYFSDHNHDGEYVKPIYAIVAANGNLIRGSHVVATNNPAGSTYRIQFDRNVSECAYSALVISPALGFAVVVPPAALPDPSSVVLATGDLSGFANGPFHLVVAC